MKVNGNSVPPADRLSKTVGKYFANWIHQDTWHTEHGSDMERFYQFVKAVLRYSNHRPGDSRVRRLIVEEAGIAGNEYLEEKATRFAALYADLLEFHDTVRFPDALVEKRNPSAYYYALEAAYGGERASEVEREMCEVWGPNWREEVFR